MPRCFASDGLAIVTGLPSTRIVPASAGVIPKITSASSLRPEPTSPAIPRISPARSFRLTPLRHRPAHDVLELQHDFAELRLDLREELLDAPSDHHLDQVVVARVA